MTSQISEIYYGNCCAQEIAEKGPGKNKEFYLKANMAYNFPKFTFTRSGYTHVECENYVNTKCKAELNIIFELIISVTVIRSSQQ